MVDLPVCYRIGPWGLVLQDEDFIRGILAYPEDDAPRLVHADWLEEQGQAERAELIRVQCELARLPAGDSHREALSQRQRQLLDQHAYQWGEPLQDLVDEFDFRRGYVECVEIGYPVRGLEPRQDLCFCPPSLPPAQ